MSNDTITVRTKQNETGRTNRRKKESEHGVETSGFLFSSCNHSAVLGMVQSLSFFFFFLLVCFFLVLCIMHHHHHIHHIIVISHQQLHHLHLHHHKVRSGVLSCMRDKKSKKHVVSLSHIRSLYYVAVCNLLHSPSLGMAFVTNFLGLVFSCVGERYVWFREERKKGIDRERGCL